MNLKFLNNKNDFIKYENKIIEFKQSLDLKFNNWMSLLNQLKLRIDSIQNLQNNNFEFLTNIGCNIYAYTKFENPEFVMVSIGYGFYLEMNLNEAIKYCEEKLDKITKEIQNIQILINENK